MTEILEKTTVKDITKESITAEESMNLKDRGN